MTCIHADTCVYWASKPTKCSTCKHNENLKDQYLNKQTGYNDPNGYDIPGFRRPVCLKCGGSVGKNCECMRAHAHDKNRHGSKPDDIVETKDELGKE